MIHQPFLNIWCLLRESDSLSRVKSPVLNQLAKEACSGLAFYCGRSYPEKLLNLLAPSVGLGPTIWTLNRRQCYHYTKMENVKFSPQYLRSLWGLRMLRLYFTHNFTSESKTILVAPTRVELAVPCLWGRWGNRFSPSAIIGTPTESQTLYFTLEAYYVIRNTFGAYGPGN